jgi:DNA-binding winged helix-turn-helix (wHTH) protein
MTTYGHRFGFGPFEVDLRSQELSKSGLKIRLGGQPFEILAALLERPGELVTREELRARIWPADTFVDFNHGLNAAVNKLRSVLNDSAEHPLYIETLPRRGYRFIGELGAPASVALPHTPAAAPPPPFQNTLQPAIPGWRPGLAYASALAGLVLCLALLGFWHGGNEGHGEPGMARDWERRASKHLEFASWKPVVRTPNLSHLDLTRPEAVGARNVVTSANDRNEGAQVSPDGKTIAFMSDRSGTVEIWTMNSDGTSAAKLTNIGNCGSPRWSPDSQWIAFDAMRDGVSSIFVVAAGGGQVTTVVADGSQNMVPSWSNDGKWIYFASDRVNEEFQVWKVPRDPGPAQKVTQHGGFSTFESFDGRTLYYSKNRFEYPEIWEVPSTGGGERRVSPLLRPKTWANWALTNNGILFLNDEDGERPALEFYDFASGGVRPLTTLDRTSFWLSASSDGQSAWYAPQEN